MNWVAWVILGMVIFESLLSFWVDLLNVRSLGTSVPKEMDDVYDTEAYSTSQIYTRVNTKFGIFKSVLSLVLFLGFWFLGGFEWLNSWVESFQFSMIPSGLLFIGTIMVAQTLFSLPFSWYHTFVIEEKFGFNKTTVSTFFLDLLKGLGLSVVLGIPILAFILWAFGSLGNLAWLYAWGVVTLFTLGMQFVAPIWIMPLFNTFTPLEEGELKSRIMEMAQKANFNISNIFVIDGSKRSAKSNAFFTGFGKTKRIALYDTLIENHSHDELVAVLAHEIGHYKKKHIITGILLGLLQSFVLFYLLGFFLSEKALYEAFFMDSTPLYAGILFFGMLYSPIEFFLSLGMNILSRKHEFEADAFAAQLVESGKPLIHALKKLSKDNLSNLTPHPWYVFLHYSHPPVVERLRALARWQ